MRGQAVDERAFACAGRAGDAGEIGFAGARKNGRSNSSASGSMIFDGGDGAREGAHFARADTLGPIFKRRHRFPVSATMRLRVAFRAGAGAGAFAVVLAAAKAKASANYFLPSSWRAITSF